MFRQTVKQSQMALKSVWPLFQVKTESTKYYNGVYLSFLLDIILFYLVTWLLLTELCTIQDAPCVQKGGNHTASLLANLNLQRERAQFCDCVVTQRQTPAQLYPAHRWAMWFTFLLIAKTRQQVHIGKLLEILVYMCNCMSYTASRSTGCSLP